jgi:hypothetical protein
MNILMLHDIREFDNTFYPERYNLPYFLTPVQFDNILYNLDIEKNDVIRLDAEFRLTQDNLNSNSTLLSFDDGLKDHLAVARKLAKRNLRGCFFIPSAPIIHNSFIDSHKIQFILASTKPDKIVSFILTHFERYFNESSDSLDHFFNSRWENNIWTKEMVFATRILREHPNKIWRQKIINELFCKYVTEDIIGFSKQFYLNLEDVNEIYSLGHIIGGHGHYSFDLRFEDNSTIITEIAEMNNFLFKFRQEQKFYAYANGGYNDFVIQEIKKNGFDYAFTTGHRSASKTDPIFELPRIDATKTNLIY